MRRVAWNKGLRGWSNSGSFKRGHPVNEKTRKAVSQTQSGNHHRKGVTLTTETKGIISIKVSNLWKNEDYRINQSKKRLGKPLSEETKRKLSIALSGENSPSWKGGLTLKGRNFRKSSQYKKWRSKVFERDNYTCKMCGETPERLEANHIKPLYKYPELRVNIDNGETLCNICHRSTLTYGYYATHAPSLKKLQSSLDRITYCLEAYKHTKAYREDVTWL